MRSRPPTARPLAVAFDPTVRDTSARTVGPEHRQPPSPYDRTLVPATVNWMRELPATVSPRETASWFPRIVNRLARFWDSPPMAESIFDELLFERRRGRKGFPPKIQAELRSLYSYYRLRSQPAPAGAGASGSASVGAELRKAPSLYDRSLNASAAKWLRELPVAVRPSSASVRFPRIVNRLARFWESQPMVAEIFEDLLMIKRPGRKGFPPDVLAEFRALQLYWQSARPRNDGDVWSSVPDRNRKRDP
jgi:hypothetical protein